MTAEQLWVIAYDSPSNKRRRKLAKLLEGYGERLQWSVFECHLQPNQLRRLRQGLNRIATGKTACVSGWCHTRPLRPSSWGSQWNPRPGRTR
jgi:CRISPR-associated protein Cas2